ncbi:helix-turn-helix domain-containing protein [Sphingomonas sp. 37zxx]|uniref:helix-turn-helix domain-containing protein n=1 Tax=Sphingomonas sp. 37zxx TaxID=1550073 RepID=UPI00068C6A17|nr:helix-turn-helix domain-containing protein [Sphingomonas sp. 37zxx]
MGLHSLNAATALAMGRIAARRPLPSGGAHRTGAPVLRNSIEAGSFEHHFFAVPPKGEPDRLVRMARAALDTGRRLKREHRQGKDLSQAERALAAMTAGAVRVFEELCMLARVNQGRVYPSYDHLAAATALGRATIARALTVLEAAGFLVRQRRFARVKNEGLGPRYVQTSNAYRAILPARILGLLPRWLRPAPLPDDVLAHQAQEAEAQQRMRAQLSCRELAAITADGMLGSVLAKLGAAIDSRESQNHPQPLMKSYNSAHAALA